MILETRDAVDGQLSPSSTEAAFANLNAGAIHPLTGPIFVKGVKPGDVLEIEFLDIAPQPTAFSCIVPGLGFLRDVMTEPFLVHWKIDDGWATSPVRSSTAIIAAGLYELRRHKLIPDELLTQRMLCGIKEDGDSLGVDETLVGTFHAFLTLFAVGWDDAEISAKYGIDYVNLGDGLDRSALFDLVVCFVCRPTATC